MDPELLKKIALMRQKAAQRKRGDWQIDPRSPADVMTPGGWPPMERGQAGAFGYAPPVTPAGEKRPNYLRPGVDVPTNTPKVPTNTPNVPAYRPGEMTFQEVRDARHDAGNDLDAQRKLALEDRRSFAREFVRDNPLVGIPSMAVLPPAEMAYKGARSALGMDPGGRSGFFDPMANIGAGWTGLGQGIEDLLKKMMEQED